MNKNPITGELIVSRFFGNLTRTPINIRFSIIRRYCKSAIVLYFAATTPV